ncbi:MAG TPA: hypothetical protein PKA29_00305 [Candidatus Saccharibacteria bacterium]|jgi:hypothetical protein|nr:hypothetical protein [Candidatus Saccharibacteria bacterium]
MSLNTLNIGPIEELVGPGSVIIDGDGRVKYKPDTISLATHDLDVARGKMIVSLVVWPDDPEATAGAIRLVGSERLKAVARHVMGDGEINLDAPEGTVTYLKPAPDSPN